MSKFLIQKTALTVEPILAVKVGLNEAIFLKQLHYWLNRTKHIKKNKKWVFNSIKEWNKQLPFFSEKTISRIIANLKEQGLLEIEQFDKNLLNRTNWYTINYENLFTMFDIKIETPNLEEKNPVIPKEKKPNEGAGFYSDKFLLFWENYPKKHGKKLAMLEFEKLDEIKQDKAIIGASRYAKDTEMTESKFIKMAKNWLKDEYFEDFKIDVEKIENSNIVDNLTLKIISYLKEKTLVKEPFWQQMRGRDFVFGEREQKILAHLGHSLEFYKEMEFQTGEIKAYLRGVIDD
ncbi:hypothetical protein [Aliarcobacter butzleri]|uniref:hypothetical protein n=1 Tax=Aliarcobacter butzleri TaxID=28197 RepID=UPI0021B68840|nr:hypothetical protein [Aliarcobacter butzleri]MCT7643859.1 hypothetical protein [Aliarcobacter butzleri]